MLLAPRWLGSSMQALMETSAGNITINLYHEEAPDTVANFVRLVEAGHYDGLHFHRVIENFMIQGGCPHSRDPTSRRAGTGGPGWEIPCERSALNLKHSKPGIFSMANSGPNSGGSQFFLTTIPTPWLDNKHTVFGRVTSGMDVVQSIEKLKTDKNDVPLSEVKILSIQIS